MSAFLATILSFFESAALSVWSKVSGSLFSIINEIPDNEIAILHDVMAQFSTDMKAGKSWGEAAADAWTVAKNEEGKELSKIANLMLEAFITKLQP